MADVLVFTPKSKFDYQKNYDDFIAFVKYELTLFSDHQYNGKKGWDCDKWSWTTKNGRLLRIVFGLSETPHKYTPYKYPFADFAKAYVRYEMSLNRKDSVGFASSLPWLYRALLEYAELNNSNSIDVMALNNSVINRIDELIKLSGLGHSGKRNIALSLERVLTFIKDKRFKLDLQYWKNPFHRKKENYLQVDEQSRNIEQDKCPSDYQMMQVAEAFHQAKTSRQKYITSLCVMLMCQPSRLVELRGLTLNSLQKSDTGRWYLMWYPAKGGDPVKKWIPELLEDVVKQAFNRLVEISRPARKAAKFAYNNPGIFMHHDRCTTPKDYPQDIELTYDQFANACGFGTGLQAHGGPIGWNTIQSKWVMTLLNELNGTNNWREKLPSHSHCITPNNEVAKINTRGAPHKVTDIKIKFPTYSDLRKHVDETYKNCAFPKYGDVNIWDCITLIRENEFHKKHCVKSFSWRFLGPTMLGFAVGAKSRSTESIFEELGLVDEDGSALEFCSHQFRHWLNTKLHLAGEDDWLIAKWSGRADINQNKAYDGRTRAQKSRLTKRIGHLGRSGGELTLTEVNQLMAPFDSETPPPPMVLHELSLPIPLKSLGVAREGVAQFSGLGYCVHNYASSPCVKNGDCATCSEHVCMKGIGNSLEELKNLENLYAEQLEHAFANANEGVFGADRWVTSLSFKLTKIRTIIKIIEDPNNPDGLIIRIPEEASPSPVKRSLLGSSDIIPTLDLTHLALSNLED